MLRRIPPVILIVLLLAVYGFLKTLITDPINTLIVLGLSALLFMVVRGYLRNGSFFSGTSGPRKPKPVKPKTASAMRQTSKKQSQSPRKDHPFRVIEGKKGKSKGKQNDQDSHNNISH